jgi:DNA invertase Pin-like site-specific DNA recombinase
MSDLDPLVAEPQVLTGALIGYARVSTNGQLLDRQERQLAEAGCQRVFADKLSGRTATRPGLDDCLAYLRPGDTFVVTRLDRLSRSLQDLITLVADLRRRGVGFKSLHEALDTTNPGGRLVFHVFASLAEFIRELIVEGTKEGLDAARARGVRLGRPPALDSEQIRHARQLLTEPDNSVASIARLLGVSRSTLYAHVPELQAKPITPGYDLVPDSDRSTEQAERDALLAQLPSDTRQAPSVEAYDDLLQHARRADNPAVGSNVSAGVSEPTTGRTPAGRTVDLAGEIGPGWRLVGSDPAQGVGDPYWYLERDGARVGTISRQFTSRLRPGWRATLMDGYTVPAPAGRLAVASGSTLWRTRNLAAAGIAEDLQTREPPKVKTRRAKT